MSPPAAWPGFLNLLEQLVTWTARTPGPAGQHPHNLCLEEPRGAGVTGTRTHMSLRQSPDHLPSGRQLRPTTFPGGRRPSLATYFPNGLLSGLCRADSSGFCKRGPQGLGGCLEMPQRGRKGPTWGHGRHLCPPRRIRCTLARTAPDLPRPAWLLMPRPRKGATEAEGTDTRGKDESADPGETRKHTVCAWTRPPASAAGQGRGLHRGGLHRGGAPTLVALVSGIWGSQTEHQAQRGQASCPGSHSRSPSAQGYQMSPFPARSQAGG